MTRKKWAAMTHDERWIKIAELCGYTNIGPAVPEDRFGTGHEPPMVGHYPESKSRGLRHPIPDYLNDLNALHAAYAALDPLKQHAFKCKLGRMFERSSGQPGMNADDDYGYFDGQCATAAQRAEALALTLEPEG